MEFPELFPGEFVRRDNRFRATVIANGIQVGAYMPNSGRLTELFTPGRRVWCAFRMRQHPAGAGICIHLERQLKTEIAQPLF